MRKTKTRAMMIALGILIGLSVPSAALEIDSTKSPLNDNTLWNVDFKTAYRISNPSSKFNQVVYDDPGYDNEYFGPDRIYTDMGKDTLVIASAKNYADALSGGPLAIALDSNILLYDNNNSRGSSLGNNFYDIVRLSNIKTLYVLGGTDSVPEKDVTYLNKNLKAKVIRIGGKDRYETSYLISKEVRNLWKDSKKSVFVSGKKLEDVIPSTPLALKMKAPIIITNGKDMPSGEGSTYSASDYQNNFIVGGKESMNIPNLKAEILSGKDRYETSLTIANKYFQDSPGAYIIQANPTPYDLEYANRYDNTYNGPVLYANTKGKPGNLNEDTKEYLRKNVSYAVESNYIRYGMSSDDSYSLFKDLRNLDLSNNLEKAINAQDRYIYSTLPAKPGDKDGLDKSFRLAIENLLTISTEGYRESGVGYSIDYAYGNLRQNVLSIDSAVPEGNNFYKISATVEVDKIPRTPNKTPERKTIKIENLHVQILDKFYFNVQMYVANSDSQYNFLDKGKTNVTMKPGQSATIIMHTLRSAPRIEFPNDYSRSFYDKFTGTDIVRLGVSGANSYATRAIPGYEDTDPGGGPRLQGYDDIYYINIAKDETSKQIKVRPYIDNYLKEKYLDKNTIPIESNVNEITINIVR